MIILVSGGAKSGKSDFAQRLAMSLAGGGAHYYIATLIPADAEDQRRIEKHLESRAGLGFETLLCPRHVSQAAEMGDPRGTYLLDSVTALLTNEIFHDTVSYTPDWQAADSCLDEVLALCRKVGNIVLVSDDIFCDAAEYDEITQGYRRALARIDRAAAAIADAVIEVSAGIPVYRKGGPRI